MSDLRLDPITGQWVAIAANRQHRPNEFKQIQKRTKSGSCPFCSGNESDTPEPILVVNHPDQEDQWLVRVVPNKFPSFPLNCCDNADHASCDADALEHKNGTAFNGKTGPYMQLPAAGVQEVIIHSPRHVESLSSLNELELQTGFQVYADRVRHVSDQPDIEHAMLFKNCRAEAGASLQHIHSQLIGTPIIPSQLHSRWQRNEEHVKESGKSILETVIDWELEQETRVVEVNERYVVLCPFASRFGYQLWIIPRDRSTRFCDLDDQSNRELALTCQRYVSRLESCLGEPAYNLLFHFAPRQFTSSEHWFVEIFPRLTRPAGFEWGTGWWVNPYSPESVADIIRG